MALPTLSDVHVNKPLTNLSVGIMQDMNNFVAGKVFPVVPSQAQSDVYFTFPRGYFNRTEAQKRAPGTKAAEKGYDVSTDNFFCQVRAVAHDVPDQLRANADSPIDLDSQGVELVTRDLMIRREVDFMTNYFTTNLWTNEVNSTPIEDVRDGKRTVLESTGLEPNTLVLQKSVYDKLLDHADIIDRIKYGQTQGSPAMANTQILAQLFEVNRVLVASGIQNTANEGQTDSHSFIAGKHALLTYSAPAPGLMTPSAGYTFSWTGYAGASAQSEGLRIKKYRRPEEFAADRIEAEMAYDLKLVSADLGYFFNGIVA